MENKENKRFKELQELSVPQEIIVKWNKKEYQKLIGIRVKDYRKIRGLTKSELEKKANLPHGYVGNLETKGNIGSVHNLIKIADALDILITDLLAVKLPVIDIRDFSETEKTALTMMIDLIRKWKKENPDHDASIFAGLLAKLMKGAPSLIEWIPQISIEELKAMDELAKKITKGRSKDKIII